MTWHIPSCSSSFSLDSTTFFAGSASSPISTSLSSLSPTVITEFPMLLPPTSPVNNVVSQSEGILMDNILSPIEPDDDINDTEHIDLAAVRGCGLDTLLDNMWPELFGWLNFPFFGGTSASSPFVHFCLPLTWGFVPC